MASASATGLPFTAPVMRLALATSMAQPLPVNLMSCTRPFSMISDSSSWSPQRGLWPSAWCVQASSFPKFRGFLLCSRMTCWYSSRGSLI